MRCAHVDIKRLKPSFVRKVVHQNGIIEYWEDEPYFSYAGPVEDLTEEEEKAEEACYRDELERFEKQKEQYDNEEPTFIFHDSCYRVLSDKGTYLSLETILDRLSVTGKFSHSTPLSAFPFSGFTVANYVKAWYNQEGKKRFHKPEGSEEDGYRKYVDFQPMSSDD